ncbi:hypothetical protein FJZ23_01795 [Candidatus Parcubacteria bacterium]|nr:hypothetical protein [Candidatus Parcubacteria bacterium]
MQHGDVRRFDREMVLRDDKVVIPAKHEGRTIARTLTYLLHDVGFAPEQIIVLVNGDTHDADGRVDDTAVRALEVSTAIAVRHQSDLLEPLMARLALTYGIAQERLHGKGTALFSACLALESLDLMPEARVFFLDADIQNAVEVEPVQRLMVGALNFQEARLVKLASLGRDNAGIHAFLATLGCPYNAIGALRWPLCGQAMVHWGDLRGMRLAGGYAVEMAMMMDLIERADGDPKIFAEVEINVPLIDKRNTDQIHVRMYFEIMEFISRVRATRTPLCALTDEHLRSINGMDIARLWVPVAQQGNGPNQLEHRYPDVIFPSVEELFP